MIVKMTILNLLGSSDDKKKKKIGVARPEEPPLRGFRPSRVSGQRSESSSVSSTGRTDAYASMHPTLVGRTDAMMFGAEGNRSQVSL